VGALVNAELLKLRTTRTFAALVGAAVALSLLVVVLTSVLSDPETNQDLREIFVSDFSGLFIMLLGVMGMAGEWRHRTITSSVLAAPDRLRLLAAKTVAFAVAGAVLSLAVTVTIMAAGTVILSARDLDTLGAADLLDVLWRNLTVAAFFGAFGVCIGGLVRNQVTAIIGLLVFAFAVEPTLLSVAEDVGRFGPTSGAPNGLLDVEFGSEDLLAPGAALGVLALWLGAAFAACAATLKNRDLT
jgi:hypothetical protein